MSAQAGGGTPTTPAATAAGVGLRTGVPNQSQIMLGATGRISHARILATHRTPAEAALFHNLVREAT